MRETERERCSECGKICYSRKEAGTIVNRNRNKKNKRRGLVVPIRLYFCKFCGNYHLTHQEKMR